MTYFVVLMVIFVGPLVVCGLSGLAYDRYVLLYARSGETEEDYNKRLDEHMRKNPRSFDPRTADKETLAQRRGAGCSFMAVPTIVYILIVVLAVASRD